MTERVDWIEINTLVEALYTAIDRLEVLFPGRKFSLDGHLAGSIGEVIAAYMFDLDLSRASTKGHDALTKSGRRVEVKFTHGSVVAIRHEPEHLIVLSRRRGGKVEVVFNGPGRAAWAGAGRMGPNGQRTVRVAAMRKLDQAVMAADRLPLIREAPI